MKRSENMKIVTKMKRLKLKIKKGDTVEVLTGADKGKRGKVLVIQRRKPLQIKVSGVRIQTKHDKKEGLQKVEGFIDYSNVKLITSAPANTGAKKKKTAKKAAAKA